MTPEQARLLIRDVADFPKPGIVFKDITPLLQDAAAWRAVVESMSKSVESMAVDYVIGVESRGFLFAAPIAMQLGLGVALIRKPGKLPFTTVRTEYELEYGTDTIEMHVDAVTPGSRVAIVDDVLATGGTAAAAGTLVRKAGAEVAGYAFMIELGFLDGRARLGEDPVSALYRY